jgi:hypothetical protein
MTYEQTEDGDRVAASLANGLQRAAEAAEKHAPAGTVALGIFTAGVIYLQSRNMPAPEIAALLHTLADTVEAGGDPLAPIAH